MRDIRQYLPYYLNQKCIVDLSRYHNGVGKTCSIKNVLCVFDSINRNKDIDQCWGVTVEDSEGFQFYDVFDRLCRTYSEFVHSTEIKLILRRIESLTEDEIKGLWQLLEFNPDFEKYDPPNITKRQFLFQYFNEEPGQWPQGRSEIVKFSQSGKVVHYLLSLGIDLFGLIDAGLAIDAATIKTEGK